MAGQAEIRQFGRYEVLAELGRGAMGVVYKAADPVLNRIVAIKTINLSLAMDERAEYEARFYQEAKAAGGLSHPNIVTIYDLGNTDEVAYMAMEFLEGKELRELIDSASLMPVRKAIAIVAQVAEGLAYAHERGIVHRDIKPANIMIVGADQAKLTDFGIARMRTSDVKTQTGMRMGSPKYMSPEQVLGQRTDHHSDIFSLGVVLYEILTGRAPFVGNSLESLMYQTLHFVPPPPSRGNPEVPEMLDLIIAKMLEKNQDDRYKDARELAADLRDCERQYGTVAGLRNAGPHAGAGGLHEPPMLELGHPGRASAETLARSREADDGGGTAALAATVGISQSFDSFEATQKLAHRVGMTTAFEDYAATARLPEAAATAPNPGATTRSGFSVATHVESIAAAKTAAGWMTNREKLYVSAMLLFSFLVAILIVIY